MYAVGRLGSYISQGVYAVSGPFHPFGGAVDMIVVEQPDGSFKSSPWYIRFGKFQGVLKTKEKIVNISVNGVEADFHMYLDHKGEAYFLQEVEVEEGESVLNPSSSGDESDGQSRSDKRLTKSKTCNFDANGKVVARTNSRRSRILGLVFGRRSIKDDNSSQGVGGSDIERESSLDRAEFAANLLEVKWSTNIAVDRLTDNKTSRFSPSAQSDGGHGKDTDVEFEQREMSFAQGNTENSLDHHSLREAPGSRGEQSVMIRGVVEEHSESACEILRKIDEYNVEKTDQDVIENGFIPESLKSDLKISCLTVLPDKQCDGCSVLEEKRVVSPAPRISEGGISERVQSFYYCEKLENSVVELNDSLEQLHEKLSVSGTSDGEVHGLAETLHQKVELLQEVLNGHQGRVSEQLSEDSKLEAVDIVKKNHSQDTNSSITFTCNYDEVYPQQSVVTSESYMDSVGSVSVCGSLEKVDPHRNYTSSSSDGPGCQVQHSASMRDAKDHSALESFHNTVVGKLSKIPSSDSSEEEQFLFSDLDESALGDDQYCRRPLSLEIADNKNNPSDGPQGNEELNQAPHPNCALFLSSDKSEQEEPVKDLESLKVTSGVVSSAISIPKSCEGNGEEDWQRQVESLPNMPLSMDNLYGNDTCHPQCHSVGTSPKSLKWRFLKEIDQRCEKIPADEDQSEQMLPTTEETRSSIELKNYIAKNAVEISLCKHLLYEGMGADAASQAFDSEKLDIDKFTSMRAEIVKNVKLVVRIGGHYFTGDATASQVLGLMPYGNEHIYEPKGMITVDRVEINPEQDPSKTTVTSNGSWRLWPFSFRRSRSQKDMQSVTNVVRSYNSETASESNIGQVKVGSKPASEGNIGKLKVVRKMVRAVTPTSEQLASLNLKEGRNVVTFTFSTPMLGKQQVDARIYLWKWNTQIVISDVDGTITKSDVLGQFMPLVGIDWSQTGVANLFSAIKENGYQLLFLSARAISQAYHTRRFLFNLKQDGKALPDGPVVISPDGLFPSLFREVIRRAPHEFKIGCLEDIKALFPPDCNPFYAGFGNRDTDELSYVKVGIPRGKIFTINPKGDVAVNRRVDTKSYTSLHALVNGMFPPMSSSEQEDFNSWNYWKLPPPSFGI